MYSPLHFFSKYCMHCSLEKREAILDEIPIFTLKKVQWWGRGQDKSEFKICLLYFLLHTF